MHESRFLVAKSNYPEKYSMSNCLVSEHGVVFCLESKIFLKPKCSKIGLKKADRILLKFLIQN